ncbi:MAG: hypothetical protein WC570_03805 [Patescibacteria group bacterium]
MERMGIENNKIDKTGNEDVFIGLEGCEERTIEDGAAMLVYAMEEKNGEGFRIPDQGDINLGNGYYREFFVYTRITNGQRINNALKLLVGYGCMEKCQYTYRKRHRDYVLTESFRQQLAEWEETGKEVLNIRLRKLLIEKIKTGAYKKPVLAQKKNNNQKRFDIFKKRVEALFGRLDDKSQVTEKLQVDNTFLLEQNKKLIAENQKLVLENAQLKESIDRANRLVKEMKVELAQKNDEAKTESILRENTIEISKHRLIVLESNDKIMKKDREIALLKSHIRMIETRKFGDRNNQFGNWDAIEDPVERLIKGLAEGKKKK